MKKLIFAAIFALVFMFNVSTVEAGRHTRVVVRYTYSPSRCVPVIYHRPAAYCPPVIVYENPRYYYPPVYRYPTYYNRYHRNHVHYQYPVRHCR